MKKLSLAVFFLMAALTGFAQGAKSQAQNAEKGVVVTMETTMGKITVMLYNDTPMHRDNFIKLVESGTYDGLLFHRVIKDFVVQAGDPKSRDAKPGEPLGDGTLGYTIPAEIHPHLFHRKGALCAARMGDAANPRRESSASQFYIVQGNVWTEAQLQVMEERMGRRIAPEQKKVYMTEGGTPHLDGEYTVFGQVIDGMEVVERMAQIPTDKKDRPKEDVRILKVNINR